MFSNTALIRHLVWCPLTDEKILKQHVVKKSRGNYTDFYFTFVKMRARVEYI